MQYVSPEGMQITAHYKRSRQSRTRKHRCTLKHTCTSYFTHTRTEAQSEDVTAARSVRSSDSTDSAVGSPVARRVFQTAGQEGRTAAPHAPSPRCPPPSPASPAASHRAGQQPSEERGGMRADGQAVSGVNPRPLRPASRTDSSL